MAKAAKSQVAVGLLIMYIAWGTTWVGIAYTVETMPPLIAMGFRFLTATSIILLFIAARNGLSAIKITKSQIRTAAILGVFMLAAGMGTATTGTKVVPIGVGSLVVASMPIWIALFRFIHKDRPSKQTLVGLFLDLLELV